MPISALSTDLYELTMMAGYDAGHLEARATFELYVRRLPPNRAFLLAAGLEQALEYLEHLRFTPEELAWLRTVPNLRGAPASFFDRTLATLRFTGEVCAVPEGTPVFPLEPLLRVTAPLIEAQLVETALLAIITFQTSIASKTARIVHAAQGRTIMEFGSRRAHGPDAALHAARAAYLAGCDSTSNVEAGFRFGVPLAGTMAHSWVKSFGNELEAFRAFAAVYGDRSIFLIDTYDTLAAARGIVASGLRPAAVRLDSGDLGALSREVRRIFDAGGLSQTRIVVSGDLDEWAIADLMAQEAPIDGFGVGTALATSKDAPALGGIYKLVEIERAGHSKPVMKLSGGKASYPGRKQVWRQMRKGRASRDVIALAEENGPPGSHALLEPVMRDGCRLQPPRSLAELRARRAQCVADLPEALLGLDPPIQYPVTASPALEDLTARTVAALSDAVPGPPG
jgi:nicotinate phosphoribosyltransferase